MAPTLPQERHGKGGGEEEEGAESVKTRRQQENSSVRLHFQAGTAWESVHPNKSI